MAGSRMGKTKFTVRVDEQALEAARQYAGDHGTTLTSLVQEFLRSLDQVKEISMDTPILEELAGSLSAETFLEDYRQYLEKKYLGSEE
jgi:hypothetical protein